jgi:hypothetical protein
MTLQLRESGPEQLGRCVSPIGAAVFCWLGYAQRPKPEGWYGP